MSLVVVGSLAYDGVATPAGRRDRILGGACTYISLAASFFTLLFTFIGHFGILAAGMASLTTSIFQLIFFLPIAIRRYRQTGPAEGANSASGDDALPAE